MKGKGSLGRVGIIVLFEATLRPNIVVLPNATAAARVPFELGR
jgi:hypothetical protein